MSVSRILLAPTHRTGLAHALAAAAAEIVGGQERQVRFHHLGPVAPSRAWDRWEGSSFLDPALYDPSSLVRLYDESTSGAALSLLAASRGLLDAPEGASWTPADVARSLDCPVVLVIDVRGWGEGIAALVAGFNERLGDLKLAGLILAGVEDRAHQEVLKRSLAGNGAKIVGWLDEGASLGWTTPAPGPQGLPLSAALLRSVARQVDVAGLERLAGQRGFLHRAKTRPAPAPEGEPPLVLVAGGQGFTPWSRDSIDQLAVAGCRVQRFDLLADEALPPGAAGLILAGHLWAETLPDVAANESLLADLARRIAEGLPTLAMGSGMLLLLRRLADDRGRSFSLAGVVPAEAELVSRLDEPLYLGVQAERDTVLLAAGQRATGWVLDDLELRQWPSHALPLKVTAPGGRQQWLEGAATPRLLCSRVLLHLASVPGAAERFAARVPGVCGGEVGLGSGALAEERPTWATAGVAEVARRPVGLRRAAVSRPARCDLPGRCGGRSGPPL